ncbi:hypothetical protein SDC9_157436 [bioreactor metagenome]|uniref:Uncharacterized protein n=1 Tax=bioreactor metagenome TaxID=1076179 RepID=A0A645F783_9ZZZZ
MRGGQSLLHSVGLLFSLTCLLNAGWIVAWHYFQIPLTMLLMILLLLSLIYIRSLIGTQHLSSRERLLVRLPFSVYFGWITVATIANATVLLVSLDWHRFGLSEQLWTVIILIVGTLIGAAAAIRFQDVPYVLVLIWAYVGILVRHVSKHGLAGRYPAVMITASLCIALLAAVAAGLFFRSGERK